MYKKFPSGELNIGIMDLDFKVLDLRTSDDFMALILWANAHKENGLALPSLQIGYFGYSRQDRVCNSGEPFSLKAVCDMINMCDFPRISVLEPHSSVLTALLKNSKAYPMSNWSDCFGGDYVVVSPDAGGEKRAFEFARRNKKEMVMAVKHRNTLNGDLSHTQVFCDDLAGKDCLIVDDICDGGATFIALSDKLREKNCGKITLFVAHGLFTKGLEVFKGKIDEIYCIENYKLVKKEF